MSPHTVSLIVERPLRFFNRLSTILFALHGLMFPMYVWWYKKNIYQNSSSSIEKTMAYILYIHTSYSNGIEIKMSKFGTGRQYINALNIFYFRHRKVDYFGLTSSIEYIFFTNFSVYEFSVTTYLSIMFMLLYACVEIWPRKRNIYIHIFTTIDI